MYVLSSLIWLSEWSYSWIGYYHQPHLGDWLFLLSQMVCNDRVRAWFLHSTYLPQADCSSTYAQSWGCPLTWGHDQTVIFISINPVWAKNYFWCKSSHFLVTFWPKRTETTQNVHKLTTILCCCLFLMLRLLDFWNAQKAHFEFYFDTALPNFCLLLSLLLASFAFLFLFCCTFFLLLGIL